MEILDRIPVNLDLAEVLTSLRIREDSPYRAETEETVKLALSLVRPRALYEVSYVEEWDEARVKLGGIWFSSRVLRRNLDQVYRVFPHIVTIGGELEEAAISSEDIMKKFQLDALGNLLLREAREHLEDHLKHRYGLEKFSRMNPGSLSDWPIQQQKELFSLFGDVEELIGVRLTDDFLMLPRKSVSGIYFPTEVPFYSCQLCARERCLGRKAAYDPKLAEEYQKPF